MKVYAVIGGDCEGQDFHSLRLFDCKSAADAYRQHLTDVEGYDYTMMEIREVCMESVLATSSLLNTADGITTPW